MYRTVRSTEKVWRIWVRSISIVAVSLIEWLSSAYLPLSHASPPCTMYPSSIRLHPPASSLISTFERASMLIQGKKGKVGMQIHLASHHLHSIAALSPFPSFFPSPSHSSLQLLHVRSDETSIVFNLCAQQKKKREREGREEK